MHVDRIVGRLRASERLLADAFMLVSDRHSRDVEIRDVTRSIAGWSTEHLDTLTAVEKKYGSRPTQQPQQLRSALLHGPRLGGLGLVEDLHDLALLTDNVLFLWIELGHASRELLDRELEQLCASAIARSGRQRSWVVGQIARLCPHALSTGPVHALASPSPRAPSSGARGTRWAWIAPLALVGLIGSVAVLRRL